MQGMYNLQVKVNCVNKGKCIVYDEKILNENRQTLVEITIRDNDTSRNRQIGT